MNTLTYQTKTINDVIYTATIQNGKVYGLSYRTARVIGKRFVQKYYNSYSNQLTTRFQNIAKYFEG
jgi:hypothetical protein